MRWRPWKRREEDLERELSSHLELEAEEQMEQGGSAEGARYAARRALGNTTRVKEEVREMWGWSLFERIWQDIRYALRQLAGNKGFTSTAILTLALGIGANTAIFTLIDAVMLKSLPVVDPQNLVRFGDTDNCCVFGGFQGRFSIFSYPLYTYFRDHTPGIEQMTAFQGGLSKVGVRRSGAKDMSRSLVDQFVSGNFLSTFGLRPFAGRLLSAADDVRAAPPVAVISYRAWIQEYGGDAAMIGSTLIIDGSPFTLVGVAPPGFFGAMMRPDPPDLWMPIADEPAAHNRNSLLDANLLSSGEEQWLYIIGRIQSGTNTKRLESELNIELKQWFLTNLPPKTEAARRELDKQYVALTPAGGGIAQMKSNYQHDLQLLIMITLLVLLIACANLANLQLARGAANATQISIRIAIGASRFRIIRQVLTESVLLAIAGGVAGLILAMQLATLLVHLVFPGARYVPVEVMPSWPVLTFTCLLSLITGVFFGIAPAWSAAHADPASSLQRTGRSTTHMTISQKSFIVLQTALSLVLLSGAGLMTLTLRNLEHLQFGFQTEGTTVVNVNAGFGNYATEKLASVYRDIEQRMRQIPGVRDAALALYSPMSGNNWQSGVTIEEYPNETVSPSWDRVSPGFFDLIGARILRGRVFDERDTPNSTHVAVVNQAFANQFFPNENPIGKRFGLGGVEQSADYQIVGLVNNIVFGRLRQSTPQPMFFLPLLQMSKDEWQNDGKARSNFIQCILLSVRGRSPDLASSIRHTLDAIDPNLTMINLMTMQQELGSLLRHEHLFARLAELFGLLALLLASIGLYGVTAYSVARRTNEIGIRTTLGATRPSVMRLILRGALTQVGIGLAIGIPGAALAGRTLGSLLYGVKTSDPLILMGATLLLVFCTVVACVIPARRAAKVDPMIAIRHQ